MGINHNEPAAPSHGGGGPINISLAADIRPVVKTLERIVEAIESNCDFEGVIDAISRIQLRVDLPEISPKIDIQPAAVCVNLPEMNPTINLTAPEGSAPLVMPAPVVNVIMPYWFLTMILLGPSLVICLLFYFLRSYL